MSEFRHDPLYRRWVLTTIDRPRTPKDFGPFEKIPDPGVCPFCEGQEDKTPPEIYAIRDNNIMSPQGWKLRVFGSKYPELVNQQVPLSRSAEGIYDRISAHGVQEIIADHPQHNMPFHRMEHEHLVLLLNTYRLRLEKLFEDGRNRFIMLYRSHGKDAGASVNHPYTQITAVPVIPCLAAAALRSAREHFHIKERCIFCDMIDQEIGSGERIVDENESYVGFVPFASRFPYEIAIYPKVHYHDFNNLDDRMIDLLARILKSCVARIAGLFENVPYNLILHTAPNITQSPRRAGYWSTLEYDWHWYIEIVPRLEGFGSLEFSTGMFVNHVPPESAAESLRAVHSG